MSEPERILDQMRRAWRGGAWHGDSLDDLLADVDAGTAAARPVSGAHTIWEIVEHIAAWDRAVRRRLDGEPVTLTAKEDWPANSDVTEEAWRATRARLREGQGLLEGRLEEVEAEALDRRVPGQAYTAGHMLDGVVQHTLYHAGQVALLKKAARTSRRGEG